MDLSAWEPIFAERISQIATSDDPAHDILHFKRVVSIARKLCLAEGGDLNVVTAAAWLHDFVVVPKNDPRRAKASQLSAVAACEFLRSVAYPPDQLDEIAHAIEAHSFSANIACQTLEARIVQDADRLDALGAIGIARCFATAGLLKRAFYSEEDTLCLSRQPDDGRFTIDHFYKKLFLIAQTLQTDAGRTEGARRVAVMKQYLDDLARET